MKKKIIPLLLFITCFLACSSEDTITENQPDKQKPTISINYENGFPKSCEVLNKDKTYIIKVMVSDNLGLASYAIDIHNNFDHHTHDDQGSKCDLDPIKKSENPWIYMENFAIESSPKTYEINQSITIPNDKDIGNYHCQISVIDVTGWQSRTSIDIKIE